MKTLEVVTWPNKILTTKTREVKVFDTKLGDLSENMRQVLKDTDSVGLAANQVGLDISMIVVSVPDADSGTVDLTLVNPKIVSSSGSISFKEQSIHFPGHYEFITRSKAVSIVYQDIDGNDKTLEASDMLAAVLQHEIDSLNGKTFLDRMSRVKKYNFMNKLKKAWLI